MRIEDVVELRVHGVSGTPPEELLDRPLVDLVAGDATVGFYRPHLEAESHDDVPIGASEPLIHGPQLEGYVWGGLTSGAPSRAFWLLLLPFTLGNVAPRLRPLGCGPRRVRLIWFVSRLLSLALTLVLVAAFVGIGVDLIGWQRGGVLIGTSIHASPGWLLDPILRLGTGRRILVGSLVPVAGVTALWLLSQRTIAKYETVGSGRVSTDDIPDEPEPKLESAWMWDNVTPVRRMRGLHLQVGLAGALAMTGAATRGAWQWIDGLLGVAMLIYAVTALWSPEFTGRGAARRWHEAGYLVWGALVVAAVGTGWWLLRSDEFPRVPFTCHGGPCHPSGLPHYGETIVWLLLAELGLVAALALLVRGRPRLSRTALGEAGPKTGLFGLGSAVIALLAVFLASVFTAGAYMFVAAWLSTGSLHPSLKAVTAVTRGFAVPEAIADAGLAYAVSVIALVVSLLAYGGRVLWAWLRISTHSWLIVPGSYAKDYPQQSTDPRHNPRTRAILRDLLLGRIVDTAAAFLGVITAIGGVLTGAFGVILGLEHAFHVNAPARWLLDRHPSGYATASFTQGPDAAVPSVPKGIFGALHPAFFSRTGLQGKGAYLVVLTLILLVTVGAAAFRLAATRRSVGILWDLASFWPRTGHPLAPPCYAERTVPELANRIEFHVGAGRGVVLAGHSQGTVLSAATVLQLARAPGRPLGQVSLLTFGCVLRRLYSRYFPTYFEAPALVAVGEAVDARWWNLWRYTDYLGGPVLSGPPPRIAPPWDPAVALPTSPGPCVDLHLVDPQFSPPPGDPAAPPAHRHSDFPKVPEFQHAVVGLAGLIGAAPGAVGPTA